MNRTYAQSEIVQINTLDGPLYHMRIPLIFRFGLINDFFLDNPGTTMIDLPLKRSGVINLLIFLDNNTDVKYTKQQWLDLLNAADYLDLRIDYVDMLLDHVLSELTGTGMMERLTIRDAINQLR